MSVLFQEGKAEGREEGEVIGLRRSLQWIIELRYPRASSGRAEVIARLPLCDEADAQWILANAGSGTFAEFKAGLEKRLKKRGAI